MKHHIMIALGLLLAMVFSYRLALAIIAPGLGLSEIYLFGGLLLAGWLLKGGLSERKYRRQHMHADAKE